jgi:isocitrate dehydrogenase kinase/phosphatase
MQLEEEHRIREAAHAIQGAFDRYYGKFLEITGRAPRRFATQEWDAVLKDAEERIGLYHSNLNEMETELRAILGPLMSDRAAWEEMRNQYWAPYLNRYHADLALIYFYSVFRRAFLHFGQPIEYADDEISQGLLDRLNDTRPKPYQTYIHDEITGAWIQHIIRAYSFSAPFQDLEADAELAANVLRRVVEQCSSGTTTFRTEMLRHPFYRNKAAYLIGRLHAGGRLIPMIIVLLHPPGGIEIDAVLTDDSDVSNVFTSARSNFHVDVDAYREVLHFLQSVAPTRTKPYIYAAIGFIHPAKLELAKSMRGLLLQWADQFQPAKGIPGTVMVTFTLPALSYVFKVIRDRSPKETFQGRKHVIRQYWMVHRMDRVGRMLDTMTFHNLRFPVGAFEKELLDHLLDVAASVVKVEGDQVLIEHLYAEREVMPLNVYLADDSIPLVKREVAVIGYGQAIKELAVAGIFVGDYLTKNFGVTRYGRVVLYDYDDIDSLMRWNFRDLPEPPEWAETLPFESWLSKGPFDVFPEHDFQRFSVPRQYRTVFMKHHADLLDPGFWNGLKDQIAAGMVPTFYPYPQSIRLHRPQLAPSE